METREVVAKYFEYVNSARWDEYLTLFADNIVVDEQLMGHVEGIEHLRKGIEVLRNNPGFRNYPREVVVEGGHAMAACHLIVPLPDGSKIEANVANLYHIEDGKITYFANYHDTVPFQAVVNR